MMRTSGLPGGTSWESSLANCRLTNEAVRAGLGGLYSARRFMCSVDFAEIEPLQHEERWKEAADCMIEAARHLDVGGADSLPLFTGTMHKVPGGLEALLHIPLLPIADATAEAVKRRGLRRLTLLRTRFTMRGRFLPGSLP